MFLVRSQGNILVNALPQESVPANIARRVLKIIREEYNSAQERVCAFFFLKIFLNFKIKISRVMSSVMIPWHLFIN